MTVLTLHLVESAGRGAVSVLVNVVIKSVSLLTSSFEYQEIQPRNHAPGALQQNIALLMRHILVIETQPRPCGRLASPSLSEVIATKPPSRRTSRHALSCYILPTSFNRFLNSLSNMTLAVSNDNPVLVAPRPVRLAAPFPFRTQRLVTDAMERLDELRISPAASEKEVASPRSSPRLVSCFPLVA